ADPMTTSGHFSRPPAGSFVAVSGQFLVAAVKCRTTRRVTFAPRQKRTYLGDRTPATGASIAAK
ncbi:MAG: hypothetical protein WCG47_09215, partial [Dermatophilaceae bacterium]